MASALRPAACVLRDVINRQDNLDGAGKSRKSLSVAPLLGILVTVNHCQGPSDSKLVGVLACELPHYGIPGQSSNINYYQVSCTVCI